MGHPRRDLLPGRRLARRRLPRRPRGLLLQSQLRRDVAVTVRRRPRAGGRGDVRTAGGHRPDAGTSPACSSPPPASGRTRNPGGLWRPVCLYDTGPVHIDRLRVLCRDADARRAHLRISTRDRQRPADAGDDAHLRRRRAGRRTAPVDRRRPERLRVDDRHRRPCSCGGLGRSATNR